MNVNEQLNPRNEPFEDKAATEQMLNQSSPNERDSATKRVIWIGSLFTVLILAAYLIGSRGSEQTEPIPTSRKRFNCEAACDNQNVICVAGTPEYDSRLPVGRLRILDHHCTAWIIAAPNIILTNAHCYEGFIVGFDVDFNYECDACTDGAPLEADSYKVVEVIHANTALDYILLRVEGDPAARWGVAPVSDEPPVVGQGIYEFDHSHGMPKGFDTGEITSVSTPGTCLAGVDIEMGISVVATGGGSGSPVFSSDSHCVIGICHCGPPCREGFAVPMSAILPDALPHIRGAGGRVVLCTKD